MARPSLAGDVVGTAERLGFHTVWVPEHVVMPSHFESLYPYSEDGKMRRSARADDGGGAVNSPDPLVWLAYVAAQTSKIRLGTGVFVLPPRDPLGVAKQGATLGLRSGGRV